MKHSLPILLFTVAPLTAAAQSKTVEVLDPGTISLEISDAEKNTITDLTVSGSLDGTDILYLIEMAGTTVYHDESTAGRLAHLDLGAARIVSGGVKYSQWPNYSTVDDEVGANMFKHTILESIVLPAGTVAIGDNAFMECSRLRSISIPESVTALGSYAFNQCSALESITLPDGITALKDATFMNCPSLKSVNIPASVTSIGGNVFNNTLVTTLFLPEGIKSIGYDAFSPSLQELHVAAREVPTAGFRAFNCVKVDQCVLYVPQGTADAYRAADQWGAFTHIVEEEQSTPVDVTSKEVTLTTAGTLPTFIPLTEMATITSLKVSGPINAEDLGFIREMAGSDEYYKPTAGVLTTLDLSDATIVADPDLHYAIHPYSDPSNPIYMTIWSTTMDANNMLPPMAFEGCHIEHIDLPASLVTIASSFCGCPLKGTLVIPEGVTHIRDYAFQGCAQLEGVVLPSTLRNVGNEDPYYPYALGTHVFEGCSALTSVSLPAGVTTIPANAFEGTGLTAFTIPATVNGIASRAFANTPALTTLTVESAEPPTAQYGAFEAVDFEKVTLVVPEGAEEAYRKADEWCYFYGLNEPDGIATLPSVLSPLPSYDLNGRRATGASRIVIRSNGRRELR